MKDTMTVTVPGAVWHDALDPLATGVPAEEGWPKPTRRRRGKGWQFAYELTLDQAESMADYLMDRAVGLALGADPDPVYAKTRKVAQAIGQQAKHERAMRKAIDAPVVR